jgi:hypothetical protein
LEVESRYSRAIERRFRSSRLPAQYGIDSFHFKHQRSRMDLKNRIRRLLDHGDAESTGGPAGSGVATLLCSLFADFGRGLGISDGNLGKKTDASFC